MKTPTTPHVGCPYNTMASDSSKPSDSTQKNTSAAGVTFKGLGDLIKLLPTGTVFLYQFLNPIVTHNGECRTIHKYLTSILLAFCGLSCFFSTFTDSYTGSDGKKHYGVVTKNGLWPSPPATESADLSIYKLRVGDFVHAFYSVIIFGVLAILDSYTMHCFSPKFESTQKVLLQVLPPAVGVVSSIVFVIFPSKRHGIGYPPTHPPQPADQTSQKL